MRPEFILAKSGDRKTTPSARDPLHGITLEAIVCELEAYFGWEELGQRIPVRCFTHDPSVKSSLKFLRRTLWAREEVEKLYVAKFAKVQSKQLKAKPESKTKTKTEPKPPSAPNPWASGAYKKS